MTLIDKDALVAEIDELKTAIDVKLRSSNDSAYWKAQSLICERLKFKVNSLEVKEGDFDAEWKRYFEHRGEIATVNVKHLAKHFFELGMQVSNKAQKGE